MSKKGSSRKASALVKALVDISIATCIAFIVIGTYLAGHAIFLLNKDKVCPEEKMIAEVAIYEGYEIEYGRYNAIDRIYMHFSDREELELTNLYQEEELKDKLDLLSPGDELDMLINPNNNTVCELSSGDTVLIDRDAYVLGLRSNNIARVVIAVFGGVLIISGASSLVLRRFVNDPKKRKRG